MGLTNFNDFNEIVTMNPKILDLDWQFPEETIQGFHNSKAHNVIMNSNNYKYFSVGLYYNKETKFYACYIIFYTCYE